MTDGCFYFGCWRGPGHYLHRPGGRQSSGRDLPADFPVRHSILDAGLLGEDRREQVEGRAVLSHIGGWTVISFWDRSVDSRPGSNSSFVLRGTHAFDVAMKTARVAFPQVFARINFPIELAIGPIPTTPTGKAV